MPITFLPRVTVDFERLMAQLLVRDGLTVLPAVDVDSLGTLPLLTFAGGNGHQIRNGYAGWEWTLFLTLYANGRNQGGDLADTIYQTVHGWDNDQTGVPGIGSVTSVEDGSMFDRIGGARLDDKNVVQYAASFLVRVVPN